MPHKRFFGFSKRSSAGSSILTWLVTSGTVHLKRHVHANKTDPLVDEVELLWANPQYAHIHYPDCRQTTVATKTLAPTGQPRTVQLEREPVPTLTLVNALVATEVVSTSAEDNSSVESLTIPAVETPLP